MSASKNARDHLLVLVEDRGYSFEVSLDRLTFEVIRVYKKADGDAWSVSSIEELSYYAQDELFKLVKELGPKN